MRITVKLYATLTDYLPVDARKTNQMEMEVPEGTSIVDVITPLQMPARLVHLVLVNGVFVPPGARSERALSNSDVLAIWPPIAGG